MGNEGLRGRKPWGKKLWGKKPLAEGLAKDWAVDRAEQVLSRRSALQALLGAGAGFVVAGCNHQESDPNPIIQPGATPEETFDPDKHQFDPSKHAPGADGGTAETGPTASSNPDNPAGSGNSEPGSGGTGQEQGDTARPETDPSREKADEFMTMTDTEWENLGEATQAEYVAYLMHTITQLSPRTLLDSSRDKDGLCTNYSLLADVMKKHDLSQATSKRIHELQEMWEKIIFLLPKSSSGKLISMDGMTTLAPLNKQAAHRVRRFLFRGHDEAGWKSEAYDLVEKGNAGAYDCKPVTFHEFSANPKVGSVTINGTEFPSFAIKPSYDGGVSVKLTTIIPWDTQITIKNPETGAEELRTVTIPRAVPVV